ncbi:glutamine synthetase [Streptomyces sp. SID4982]|uniref:glutamine synthetase n=1 Tax=Streptomyces sp. SID4982 TaxID=2690291 RepID=UPI001927C1A9
MRGGPQTANDDQRRPLGYWSALGRPRSREVAPDPCLFLRNKRQEWEEYRSEVTAFELRKNLPVL